MTGAVTAITLNPCTDRTLRIDKLTPGGHHVVQSVMDNIAGKGIDVNVVLRHLGIPTLAAGFSFSDGGQQLEQFLRAEDIPCRLQPVRGSQRINTKIFDASAGQMTELNCRGPELNAGDEAAFLGLLETVLPQTAVLVVCGSVPPGISPEIYRRITERAHARSIPVVLDATGPLFAEALKACPEVIKPNIGELELYLGRSLRGMPEYIAACRDLTLRGIGAVCLTLGKDGALMVTREKCWFSEGLDIPVRGVQGAGDSVVAGICAAMLQGNRPGEWLRSGVAAAHGSLVREGTLLCEKGMYEAFLEKIPVKEIQA